MRWQKTPGKPGVFLEPMTAEYGDINPGLV